MGSLILKLDVENVNVFLRISPLMFLDMCSLMVYAKRLYVELSPEIASVY